MKNFYLPLVLIFFLVGCAKEPPKCSDEKTLNIVRDIVSRQIGIANEVPQNEAYENLKFEFTKATAFDKDIKKISCATTLIAGDSYRYNINYESQLDDNNEHIVESSNISVEDAWRLKRAVLTAIEKNKASNAAKQETQSSSNNAPANTSQADSNANLETLLNGVYEKYLPNKKCWIASDENKQNYCMRIDSFEKVSVKGINRFYAMLSGTAVDAKGEENGSHASSGLVAAFVMEENANQLRLIASNSKISMGASGAGPTKWKLVKVGPDDYYGWTNQSGNAHGGYSGTYFHVLAPNGANIKNIAEFVSSFSDQGRCSDEPCQSTTLNSSIELDTSKTGGKVYPLKVTVKGKEEGAPIPSTTYTFNFDETKWNYVTPSDYKLIDSEF